MIIHKVMLISGSNSIA